MLLSVVSTCVRIWIDVWMNYFVLRETEARTQKRVCFILYTVAVTR